jgi:hypothetical protein
MILARQRWTDLEGRKHKLYTVRSLGLGQGVGVIDVLRNVVISSPYYDRQDAWDFINHCDDETDAVASAKLKGRRA